MHNLIRAPYWHAADVADGADIDGDDVDDDAPTVAKV
jgi:hypothetical protein